MVCCWQSLKKLNHPNVIKLKEVGERAVVSANPFRAQN